jgi:predicted RNA binding protein YcfA (HicA-like mRNA interferase family)
VSGRKIIKALNKLRWRSIRIKGDHVLLEGTTSKGRTVVPVPLYSSIDKHLFKKILKETETELKDILRYLFMFLLKK